MGKMPFRQLYFDDFGFSIVKGTPLHENLNLQLRAESFNLYNAMIPGAPSSTTIGVASAGLATDIGNTPRELQFAAKITP